MGAPGELAVEPSVPPFAGGCFVPTENYGSTFATYAAVTPEQIFAAEDARYFLKDPNLRGLMLTGPGGNGKTHLAVSMARQVAEQGGRAAFIPFQGNSLLLDPDEFPASRVSSGGSYDIPGLASAYDLIVVDDVPRGLSIGQRFALQTLFLASYDLGKKLVLTSNASVPEVAAQIAEKPEKGSSELDRSPMVIERLRTRWEAIEFPDDATSYRATQKEQSDGPQRPESMQDSLLGLESRGGLEVNEDLFKVIGDALLALYEASGAERGDDQRIELLRIVLARRAWRRQA